jgi:O-antigen ligase
MTRAFTEGSLGSRNVLWENTSRLLADRPIQGAGLGSFQKVYKRYRTSSNQELLVYPHMIVLNFWVELGVVGLSAGAGIVYLSLKNAWQRIQRQKHAVFIALLCVWITVLVHGLIDVPFFNNDLSFLWWLLVWG